MRKKISLMALLAAAVSGGADTSVVRDLGDLYKIQREGRPESISLEEYWARREKIKARVTPIVQGELAKLKDGELTPLARELLNDPESIDFCAGVLRSQFQAYPNDTQTNVLEKAFAAMPDSLRGRVILEFSHDLPKESFSGNEMQQWLVETINGGLPAGALYFILTDESSQAVTQTAIANMKRFAHPGGHDERSLFSLASAVFLASKGNGDAVKLLEKLLDQRNANSIFDLRYIIPAAAMSGNEGLIKKLLTIVTTDQRVFSFGPGDGHEKISFAHTAALACSLVIEGFPAVKSFRRYDDETKEKVLQWIESNPAYAIRLEDPRIFFKETRLQAIFPAMARTLEAKTNRVQTPLGGQP